MSAAESDASHSGAPGKPDPDSAADAGRPIAASPPDEAPGPLPMPGAAPTLPTGGQALILYVVVMFLFLVASGVLAGKPPAVRASVGSLGVILFPTLLYAVLFGVDLRATFRIFRPAPGRLLLTAVAAATAFLLLTELVYLQSLWFPAAPDSPWSAKEILRRELEMIVAQPWWQAVLILAVLPAMCEEFLFRGYLLTGLERGLGRTAGLAACALLFGLMHVIPIRVVATSLLGLLFGFVCYRGGGLAHAVLAHGINNLMAVSFAKSDALRAVPWLHGEAHVPVLPLVCALAMFASSVYLLAVDPGNRPEGGRHG